ncbi:hypothetical protein PL11201_460032 [Planktothrix sp. PCC 11201]|uniref:hypothetical protein n=1 Tax=Planktothrix sp. PCC 11201 TaxID=1729650 RepID=UPI00091EE72B|nr:hypothetical protein [Planktothrix sp. PCC 11201]SKB13023.1 hypothetical protein PL11201_460032 [Planktothrix sp. PCC 11201]
MINLLTFSSLQNTTVTIKSSYQNIDDTAFVSATIKPNIFQEYLYNLSPRIESNDQSYQKIACLLQCILILTTLSQNGLEEAYQKLESIQQIDKITTDNYSIESKLELEAKFNTLAEEWRAETRMLSLVTQKSMHSAYQRIIGMGQPVVPLILRDLEQKPDHWFWALRAITGDNPVKSEQCGRMKLMAQAWIQWGKEHGYEW